MRLLQICFGAPQRAEVTELRVLLGALPAQRERLHVTVKTLVYGNGAVHFSPTEGIASDVYGEYSQSLLFRGRASK